MEEVRNIDLKKINSLANKLKSLSERGEVNESNVAKEKLESLLKKHKIKNVSDLDIKERIFKIADWGDCKTIMTHCILDTANVEIQGCKKTKELFCFLTDYQYFKVCEKFNHYYPLYINKKDNLIKSFLIENNLGIL
jgi:hypothetical protein